VYQLLRGRKLTYLNTEKPTKYLTFGQLPCSIAAFRDFKSFFAEGDWGYKVANTKQAKKRVRQAAKHRTHNASRRAMLRTYIKKVVAAIEKKDLDVARSAFKQAVPVIDKIAMKGLIHKNKAARLKSRLSDHIKELEKS
jgi:small subunit ribosomal protein S20